MARQAINVGSSANDGTGDTERAAWLKANANFVELYGGARDLPALLPNWRVALANAFTGSARAKIVQLGDSTTVGAGSNDTLNGLRTGSVTAHLRRLLAGTGLPVTDDTVVGDNYVPNAGMAGITAYNPNITFSGSGWIRSPTSLGGAMFRSQSTGDACTYTPTYACDRLDIYYPQDVGNGTFTVSDASGTLATVNSGTSPTQITKLTVTRATASTAPITITHTAGSDVYIAAIDGYNSAVKAISLYNCAGYGTQASFLKSTSSGGTNPWAQAVFNAIAPDLTIINYGINETRFNTDAATYSESMQWVITMAKRGGAGDVLLVWHHPDNNPLNPSLTEPTRQACYALAAANNLPLIDLTERFGSYAAMSAVYYDSVHLRSIGYSDVARALLPGVLP